MKDNRRVQTGKAALLLLSYVALLCVSLAVYWVQASRQQEASLVQTRLEVHYQLMSLQQQVAPELASAQEQLQVMLRSVAVIKDNTAASGYYSNLRKAVQNLLQQQLAANQQWRATYSIWTANGIDGQDEVFEGDEEYGSNQSGRFASRWQRDNDSLTNRVISEIDLTKALEINALLSCQAEQNCDPELHFDDSALLKMIAPIVVKRHVVAVLGVELSLSNVKSRFAEWRRDNAQGRLALLGRNGEYLSVDSEPWLDVDAAALLLKTNQPSVQRVIEGQEWFAVKVSAPLQDLWLVYRLPSSALIAPLLVEKNQQLLKFVLWLSVFSAAVIALTLFIYYRVGPVKSQALNELDDELQRLDGERPMAKVKNAAVIERAVLKLKALNDDCIEQNGKVASLLSVVEKSKALGDSKKASIERLRQVVADLRATRQNVSAQAEAIHVAAGEAADSARQGVEATESACMSFSSVADDMQQMSDDAVKVGGVLAQLKEDSEKIVGIITVISSIAEQTNLLALNAAIESARAGEHGRGFAVVADEVRGLAKRTQESTGEVRVMIDSLVAHADEAGKQSEKSLHSVESNAADVYEAREELQGISMMVSSMVAVSEQVTAAAIEQLDISQSLSASVESVDESLENAEQVYTQEEQLKAEAVKLLNFGKDSG